MICCEDRCGFETRTGAARGLSESDDRCGGLGLKSERQTVRTGVSDLL